MPRGRGRGRGHVQADSQGPGANTRGRKRAAPDLDELVDDTMRQNNAVGQIQGSRSGSRPRPQLGTYLSLEHLQSRARDLLYSSVAPNTMSTYLTGIRAFDNFRASYHLPNLWPVPASQIIAFLTLIFEKGLSPKSITTYFAGINYFHKLQGFTDLSSIFIIRKILEGCHRRRFTCDRRAPLTENVLFEICSKLPSVCYSFYETKLFTALFCLAYFGLFRVSELTAPSQGQIGHALRRSDVSITPDGIYLIIQLRHSKTNQRGKPVLIKISRQTGALCPLTKLLEFLELRPYHGTILFCHEDGSVVTRCQFTHVLATALNKTKYHSGHYRSHSFRIGRATDLAAEGYGSEAIKMLGRWSSNCYNLYIRR